MEKIRALNMDWQSGEQKGYYSGPGIRSEYDNADESQQKSQKFSDANSRFFSQTATLDWLATWRQTSFN